MRARSAVQTAAVVVALVAAGWVAPSAAGAAAKPAVSVADVRVVEGSGAPAVASFVVTLDRPSTRAVTVDLTTVDWTAKAGSDYLAFAGSVRLDPGATAVTVAVPLVSDTAPETPRVETFGLRVSGARRAEVADGDAVATVVDDDLPCDAYASRVWRCTVPGTASLGAIDPRVLVMLPAAYDHLTPLPVVYLLHGVGDTYETWVKNTDVETFAATRRAIVVMPDGGKGLEAGWYSDWHDGSRRWETFHTDVLVRWVDATFATAPDATHRAVAGISMGGFGAMYYAAAHRDVFGAAASISGILDTQLGGPVEGIGFLVAHGSEGYTLGTPDDRVWGNPVTESATWAAHNPSALAAEGKLAGLPLWVRTGNGVPAPDEPFDPSNVDGPLVEQFVWQTNQQFRAHAALGETELDYADALGTHDWPYHQRFLHELYDALVAAVS
jgi:S-formylglutathione hydrolase FrmB